ncbi:hypothetical protein ACFJIW_05245 [Tahibacter sp. UC22_41]|uniref:hypothetical protein n=1 Tax=Tahibacter sp. UC22_41 TaxID=3350178 RepID=UPI0036DDF44B
MRLHSSITTLLLIAAAVPSQAAILQGRVVETGSGAAIADAEIAVVGPVGFGQPGILYSARSDADGRYVIDTGSYERDGGIIFVATAAGHAGRSQAGEPCQSAMTCLGAATPAALSNATPTTADFSLARGARISGRLQVAGGTTPALSGFVALNYISAPGSAHLNAGAAIQADGSFAIDTLHGGSYALRVYATDSASGRDYLRTAWPDQRCDDVQIRCADLVPQPIIVADGATIGGLDAELRTGTHLRVRLLSDGNGQPVEHSLFVRAAAAPQRSIAALSGGDGYAVAGPLLHGPVKLELRPLAGEAYPSLVYPNLPCSGDCDVSAAPPVTILTDTGVTTLPDAHVTPRRTVSGVVTDRADGQPIAGVTVAAGSLQPASVYYWGLQTKASAVTDAQGRYTLEGFAGDPVVIATRAAQSGWIDRAWADVECNGGNRFCNATWTPYAAPDFTAQPYQQGIDFALAHGANLSGRVVFAGIDAPASGYAVAVVPAEPGFIAKPVYTDANGHFRIDGLTAQGYYLFASSQPAFADTAGTLYPDRACVLASIDAPLSCSTGPGQLLTPTAGGSIGNLTIVVPNTDTIFSGTFD